ncbi:hypothetical protein FISHEDRAFT_69907 [Fistulina hepatica ATCC 64428]|uniref:Uncharacterized protein n=1 Tax=Fistulina hepatica ATCC 64428 TaxID=1128425 RepID=A0A0D7ANY7_9AGAR|nr:hypothetical protein FISHEDRAFT_69907 [Fistulina hepatica ATCC 64428]
MPLLLHRRSGSTNTGLKTWELTLIIGIGAFIVLTSIVSVWLAVFRASRKSPAVDPDKEKQFTYSHKPTFAAPLSRPKPTHASHSIRSQPHSFTHRSNLEMHGIPARDLESDQQGMLTAIAWRKAADVIVGVPSNIEHDRKSGAGPLRHH